MKERKLSRVPSERFYLLLIPSWLLSVFYLIVFLKNSGLFPKTPVGINDVTYPIASFVFFVLPFVSRLKVGQLLELDRKVMETRRDVEHFKNETRHFLTNLAAASANAVNIVNLYGIAREGEVERTVPEQKNRSATELKILNTLWNRQVLRFPELDKLWTFTLCPPAPEYVQFREAGNRLMGEGLICETEKGQFGFTRAGLRYCAEHYKDFPADMWFDYPLCQNA